MTTGNRYSALPYRWFELLILVSVCLLLFTFVSYASQGPGLSSRIFFLIGLGGENNIGAWWSGMLLLLASVLAFDGFRNDEKREPERRAWLALAIALLLLSFDEVASLHEYLGNAGKSFLILPALTGAGLVGYAMYQLIRLRVGWRIISSLLVAFALLATIPAQEIIQHSVVWDDQVLYGLRAVVEEGAELIAMLLLISATRGNTAALLRKGSGADALAIATHYRQPLILGAAILIPFLTAATFVLPYPGGPADWLASALYLSCALHLVRRLLLHEESPDLASWLLLALYLAASAMSNTVHFAWDPALFGTRMSLRGLGVVALLVAVAAVLQASGRPPRARWLNLFALAALAVLAALAASFWPDSQIVWCALPPLAALFIYGTQSKVSEGAVAIAVKPPIGLQGGAAEH